MVETVLRIDIYLCPEYCSFIRWINKNIYVSACAASSDYEVLFNVYWTIYADTIQDMPTLQELYIYDFSVIIIYRHTHLFLMVSDL